MSSTQALSPLYAARVAAFTMLHMNNMYDVAAYWWVSDYGWSPLCFGLITRNGTHTPVFDMFTTLFAQSLDGLQVVTPTWTDGDAVQTVAVARDLAQYPGRNESARIVAWVAYMPTAGTALFERVISFTNVTWLDTAAHADPVLNSICYPQTDMCTVKLVQLPTDVDNSPRDQNNVVAVRVTLAANAVVRFELSPA